MGNCTLKQYFSHVIKITCAMLLNSSALAVKIYDTELAQSNKCVKLFKYFEVKHQIPKDLLHSIALQETGRKHSKLDIKIPWPWTVNVEGRGYYFDTKHEAIGFTQQQLAFGKRSMDVGCMQINLKHHPDAFKDLNEAFEPRYNIDYGANFLKEKYLQTNNWHKAIAYYHSANEEFGSKYHQSVLKIVSNIDKHKFEKLIKPALYQAGKPLYVAGSYKPLITSKVKRQRYKSNMMVYVPRGAIR